MIILGLTGSIGMGKTTIASMLENLRIPVHDSDAAVHGFYAPDSFARPALAAAFPFFEYPQIYERKTKNMIRAELGKLVFSNPELRERLENILHPLVRKSQMDFIRQSAIKKRKMICLDIPLLYETGAQDRVDYVLVASAPYHVQRARVLARPTMTEEKFHAILSSQMPDREKCIRADYVIKTGLGRAYSFFALKKAIASIEQIHTATFIEAELQADKNSTRKIKAGKYPDTDLESCS